jgi:hypothetical protein
MAQSKYIVPLIGNVEQGIVKRLAGAFNKDAN